MKKIELHVKTKYSYDMDSTIDIETLLWNAKENKERGIIFVDKDTIVAFPKIEKVYKKLCEKDKSFKEFKIGYGVQITCIIGKRESEILLLVKNQLGLKDLYKIISIYLNKYNKRIPIEEVLSLRENLLIGIMINDNNLNIDLSIFDYLEINDYKFIAKINDKYRNKIVYSNVPNALFEGEKLAKEILYFYKKINKEIECRLYLDTEDTLKICNDRDIVIYNSNNIFNNLDRVIINDGKFYITHVTNFKEFENLVRKSFSKKYRNPSLKTIKRLDEELDLIEKMEYTYFFNLLIEVTNFCKSNKEYYQLDGYINNSLVSYVLGITEIEPYNLPYELFFSEIPSLEIKISPEFYYDKMFTFFINKLNNNLIKCNYGFKLSKSSILRMIKQYENKKEELSSSFKDYVFNILEGMFFYKENLSHAFYLIPEEKDIFDFCPYEEFNNSFKGTHFDYHDLLNNLIKIRFMLDEDIKGITNLINKTNYKVEFCNDKRVFNLFRNTEEFGGKFKILDKINGTLNIRDFGYKELESRLKNIPNIWIDDLVDVLVSLSHGIIKDDLYLELKKRGLDDVYIFNVINYLKEIKKVLFSRAFLLNKIRISYMQMYYKLYYPKEYYEELLNDKRDRSIYEKIFNFSILEIEKRYSELKSKECISLEENEELELLEILIEMYERNI